MNIRAIDKDSIILTTKSVEIFIKQTDTGNLRIGNNDVSFEVNIKDEFENYQTIRSKNMFINRVKENQTNL